MNNNPPDHHQMPSKSKQVISVIAMKKAAKCNLCSEALSSLDKINAHIKRQHGGVHTRKKNFKCNVCGYERSRKDYLIDLMRTDNGERPFQCTVTHCGMAFKRKSNLENHIKQKHSDKRPFQCDFFDCHYTAKTSKTLLQHKKVHIDERPFTCPKVGCSFRAKSKSHITQHVKCTHSKTKAFVCTKCDYKTALNGNLKRHMLRHSARRDFKCSHPQCRASFKISSHLKQNLSNQHGEKNLQCVHPGCGRYFPNEDMLMNHLKLHNPSCRPFQCILCFKYFTTLDHLQRHCFVHTNEKPFQCGHCEFEAARPSQVKSHISSAHANIQFPFVVHPLEAHECLRCKVIFPEAEFLVHSMGHKVSIVVIERRRERSSRFYKAVFYVF